ncbi:glycosidase [Actinomyces bowdenii]|uniref:glycosidase n=1 Tax=Actinomyces bowdenii TaxID=131109 RepID=UPI00214B4A43|nr:glycosidase [Actinomyces bowdenii]MCR2051952.1 glycosidase [Actinomyces bowdenii]
MTTTTTLVHRPYDGPEEWWRHALVYEFFSPDLGPVELQRSGPVLDHIASLGFEVVLLRPSLVDTATRMGAVEDVITRAHDKGLRAIVRVSGALGPITGPHAGRHTAFLTGLERPGDDILRRAEAYLRAGADGIDLGTIVPPALTTQTDLGVLSRYVATLHGLVAEYTEDGVVGADVTADHPDSLRHHLQDDWVHHLRDDRLTLARWDPGSMTAHLTQSFDERCRFGAQPSWRFMPPHALLEELDPGDGMRWYATDPAERLRRATALQSMMLALPGSVYLRQGDEIAMADADKPDDPLALAGLVASLAQEQQSGIGSPVDTVRHATHVRQERGLACAPMAFVTGLEWSTPKALTFLSRDVLVLVNMSDISLALPAEARVLLSSQSLGQDEGRLLVPPTTAVWLEAVTVA